MVTSNEAGQQPLVSVVIPVFNRIHYLGATIDSVLRQSLAEWELFVIDDGSTEDVKGCVAQYEDPRIQYLRQENCGNAAARNAGARLARAPYLAFLDSDDLWHPEMLRRCCSALGNAGKRVGVVYCRWNVVDHAGEPASNEAEWRPLNGNLLHPLAMGLPIFPSAALLRRDCFEACGGFDESLDDWDLWLRISLAGYRFASIADTLASYRLHGSNLHLNVPKRADVHFRTLEKLFSARGLPASLRKCRDAAFGHQHWQFCLLAFRQRAVEAAIKHFIHAAVLDPTILRAMSTYFDLAGAVKAPNASGTSVQVDVRAGERNLLGALEALFGADDLSMALRAAKTEAYARAHYALGMISYWFSNDITASRKHFLESLYWYPELLFRTNVGLYLGKTSLGLRGNAFLRRQKHRLREWKFTVRHVLRSGRMPELKPK